MSIDSTPISVLEKEIKHFEAFIRRLQTREGITKHENENEEEHKKKFDKLISDYRLKINEFQTAINILNKNK